MGNNQSLPEDTVAGPPCSGQNPHRNAGPHSLRKCPRGIFYPTYQYFFSGHSTVQQGVDIFPGRLRTPLPCNRPSPGRGSELWRASCPLLLSSVSQCRRTACVRKTVRTSPEPYAFRGKSIRRVLFWYIPLRCIPSRSILSNPPGQSRRRHPGNGQCFWRDRQRLLRKRCSNQLDWGCTA